MLGGPVRRLGWVLLAGASISAYSLPARADGDKPGIEACASASESAQTLLDAHKLLAARAKLLVCARTSCPAVIKRDCDELLSRAEAAIPTIVLSVKDAAGRDVVDAKVLLDGVTLANALQGQALRIDPGSHTLRFERDGSSPVELPVVAHEGERDREVQVQLGAAAAAPQPPPATVRPTAPSSVLGPASAPPAWIAWTLGGVGVVGLGTFVALAATGQSQYNDCKASGCSQSESASLERERVGGFVLLGVGLAASTASVWLFVKNANRHSGEAPARVGIGATPTGASLLLGGTF
jgi:hypothetical protein